MTQKYIPKSLEEKILDYYNNWIIIAKNDFNLSKKEAQDTMFEFYKIFHKKYEYLSKYQKDKYYDLFIKQFDIYVVEHKVGIRKWKKYHDTNKK